MKYIISLSGGLGSAASAILAHEHGLDFELWFCDVLMEDPDLYRFNDDVSAALGKEIFTITDGRTPYDVFEDERYIGNTRAAYCSKALKNRPFRKEMNRRFGKSKDDVTLVLGMGLSELDRIERAEERWKPYALRSFLRDYQAHTSDDLQAALDRHGLKRPALYDYGFPHNNCGGACVKGGLTQWATVLKHFPERFGWHERRLNQAMETIGPTAKPFLRQVRQGVTHYMTLTQFRVGVEDGSIDVPLYDFGGCGCFSDG